MTLLPATDADLVAFYGVRPPVTVRALVGRVDGELFGVIGLARRDDAMVFFSDYKPHLKGCLRSRETLRGILQVRDWMRASRLPTIALADINEPDSDRLMIRLGFELVESTVDGGLYRWHS